LHSVQSQDSNPYRYGLVDDEGTWLIPMGSTYRVVKPFSDGVAEVILNDANTT
jgi:hypothetical protein